MTGVGHTSLRAQAYGVESSQHSQVWGMTLPPHTPQIKSTPAGCAGRRSYSNCRLSVLRFWRPESLVSLNLKHDEVVREHVASMRPFLSRAVARKHLSLWLLLLPPLLFTHCAASERA